MTAQWVRPPRPVACRRYEVGYALADGKAYRVERLPFFRLTMAEKYADYMRAYLTTRWRTFAVFIWDLNNPERGDVYGTEED